MSPAGGPSPHPAVSLGGGGTETMYTVVPMLDNNVNVYSTHAAHILSCVAIATGSAMETVALGNHP